MRVRIAVLVLALFPSFATLVNVSPAQAAISCHAINGKGVGQDLGGGNTVADIHGAGLLHGSTVGSFVPTGTSGSVVFIAGTVVFTVNRATLTVTITGSLDLATGVFTASGPVTGATGKLAGATGTVSLAGVENLATGSFVEAVSGNVCVDLAP